MAEDLATTIEELAQAIAAVNYLTAQESLADIYRLTQFLILDEVERVVRARPDRVPEQLQALMAHTASRLRQADAAAAKWVDLHTPQAFRAGLKVSQRLLAEQGQRVNATFTQVHRTAVEAIVRDTMGDLLRATHLMEERVKDRIRRVFAEELRGITAAGFRGGDQAQRIVERLAEEQIFGITDKRGRFIPMDHYAKVVANTKLREAHTRGTEANIRDNGGDLVRISTHLHIPDPCSAFEGKVYSLTGRTPGYPVIQRHTPFHPSCRHVELPFVETFRSEAELDKIRAESNRPDQITVYSAAQLDGLKEKRQKRERYLRARRVLRRQDEQLVASGKKAPPRNVTEQAAYERSLTARANAAAKRAGTRRKEPLTGARVLSSRMAKNAARVVVEPGHVDAVWDSMQSHLNAGVLPEGMERSDVELVAKYLSKARAPLTWNTIRKGGDLGASALLHEFMELKWYSGRGLNPFNPKVQAKHYPTAHVEGLIAEHNFLFALARERGYNLNQKGSLVRWNPNALTEEQQVRDVQWMQRIKPGLRFDQADEREAIRFYARLQREQNALPSD